MVYGATVLLLILSGISIRLAFTGPQSWLNSTAVFVCLWAFILLNGYVALRALWRMVRICRSKWGEDADSKVRRPRLRAVLRSLSSVLFHGGMVLLIIGAGRSMNSMEGYLPLSAGDHDRNLYDQSLMTPTHLLPFTVEMLDFTIETYDDGTHKQYISDVRLINTESEERFRGTLWVNNPLRHTGWTLYQMSYGKGQDRNTGQPVWYSTLLVKYDPGVPWVYASYIAFFIASFLTIAVIFMRKRGINGN